MRLKLILITFDALSSTLHNPTFSLAAVSNLMKTIQLSGLIFTFLTVESGNLLDSLSMEQRMNNFYVLKCKSVSNKNSSPNETIYCLMWYPKNVQRVKHCWEIFRPRCGEPSQHLALALALYCTLLIQCASMNISIKLQAQYILFKSQNQCFRICRDEKNTFRHSIYNIVRYFKL